MSPPWTGESVVIPRTSLRMQRFKTPWQTRAELEELGRRVGSGDDKALV